MISGARIKSCEAVETFNKLLIYCTMLLKALKNNKFEGHLSRTGYLFPPFVLFGAKAWPDQQFRLCRETVATVCIYSTQECTFSASYLWSCEAVTCPAPQQEGRRCADAALSRQTQHSPAPAELGLTLLSDTEGTKMSRGGKWEEQEEERSKRKGSGKWIVNHASNMNTGANR